MNWGAMLQASDVPDVVVGLTLAGFLVATGMIRPDWALAVGTRLMDVAVAAYHMRALRWFVGACVVALLCGTMSSVAIRAYNGHPTLVEKAAAARGRWQPHRVPNPTIVELFRPEQTFYELLDPCNDLDYAAQWLAIGGAAPFVISFKVLPQFAWNDIIVPFVRWFLVTTYNAGVRFLTFLKACADHAYERAVVFWHICVTAGEWIAKHVLSPVAKRATEAAEFVWSAICAVSQWIWQIIVVVLQYLNAALSRIAAAALVALQAVWYALQLVIVNPGTVVLTHLGSAFTSVLNLIRSG